MKVVSKIKKIYKSYFNMFYFKTVLVYLYSFLLNVFGRGAIVVHSWVYSRYAGNFRKNNWGDDINKYMFEELTGKKVLFISDCLNFNRHKLPEHYMFIGSILAFFNLDNAVIYGTGIKNPDDYIVGNPQKILSVRGPRTRQCLIEHNIDCPEIYGDPALLLPLIYTPKKSGKCMGVVIANENTEDDNSYLMFLKEKGFRQINLKNYDKWTDIIDLIANSDFVVSESLHGLIVAETYGVPSVWVEFKEHPAWWSFKYNDFFESVDKYEEESIKLYQNFDLDLIMKKAEMWKRGNIDYKSMIDAFPLEHKLHGFN